MMRIRMYIFKDTITEERSVYLSSNWQPMRLLQESLAEKIRGGCVVLIMPPEEIDN